jgi:hypothetical protein
MLMLLICGSCKVTNTVYQKGSYAKLIDTSVSKGNVLISLSPMDINEYFQPEYNVQYPVLWGSKLTSTRHTTINLFYQMAVYKVEIANNTNNVLSLSDSRIALILPDAPEPIFALSKLEMEKLIEIDKMPCISYELSQASRAYSDIDIDLTREAIRYVTSEIVKGKSIVSRTTEVLPGMNIRGFLVFPYDGEKITSGTISFIDIKSNTDEAGNTMLKTRFDYKVIQEQLFVKREYSQEQRKYSQFIRITEEEYNAAQQSNSNSKKLHR